MKAPRFRIAWVMVAVSVAALDFAVMRMVLDHHIGAASELIDMGGLPIANLLAVGLFIGQKRRGSRPFLLGFKAVGVMALALYVALAVFSPQTVIPYLELSLEPIRSTIGLDRTIVLNATIYSVVVVMLGWPQVAFALIGGFLSRRVKVTITRR
jgi:hypothetical protein